MADLVVSEVDLHHAYRDVFTSQSGRIVLADLVRHFGFTKRSTIVPGDAQLSAANEGSRRVVVWIERRLTQDPQDENLTEPQLDPEPAPFSSQQEGDEDAFGFSD